MPNSNIPVRKATGAPGDLAEMATDLRVDGLYRQIYTTEQLKTLVDDAGGGVMYVGDTEPGTLTSVAEWRIKRITEVGTDLSVEWADSDIEFDNVWDDRAILTYS